MAENLKPPQPGTNHPSGELNPSPRGPILPPRQPPKSGTDRRGHSAPQVRPKPAHEHSLVPSPHFYEGRQSPPPEAHEPTTTRLRYYEKEYTDKEKRYRKELLKAALEALDAAQRDVEDIQRRVTNSGDRDLTFSEEEETDDRDLMLSEETKAAGTKRLWEAFLQDPKFPKKANDWTAVEELTSQISALEDVDIDTENVDSLLRTIDSLRAQVKFVERHRLPTVFAGILNKAAKKLRWKAAIILSAVLAELAAGGNPITLRILVGALAVSSAGDAATAAMEEIRAQLANQSQSHTPQARAYDVTMKLLDPLDTVAVLLQRRAAREQVENGESDVLRIATVTAGFLIINAMQRILDYHWPKQGQQLASLREAMKCLDPVLDMVLSGNCEGAATAARAIITVADKLQANAPRNPRA